MDSLFSWKDRILEAPICYSLWSSLLNGQKIRAIRKVMPVHLNLSVLDIGCGPGTNTRLFKDCRYTGVDINERYIAHAKATYPQRDFFVQDITKSDLPPNSFDLVLINSLLHHMQDKDIESLFASLSSHNMKTEGRIVISEPLTAPRSKIIRHMLERLDRGDYFRTYEEYSKLLAPFFLLEKEYIYPLRISGVIGWQMLTMCLIKKNDSI
ncbi:MAG: class I SAM-dependent methyltransferase [Deltaproteobacteria bacterium]|nr:class I SAM-dependent methyltransferase [Deltaproteobacteria bacterium]